MKITSVANKIIEDAILLKETKYQKKYKKYFIEGEKMVDLAISKNEVETVFVESSIFKKYSHLNDVIEISSNVAKKLTDLKTNQGVFAICKINEKEEYDSNYLLLDGIQDPGNLGTLIRSAFAFNFKNVICSPSCVSFYNPKVLRATQSNHFDLFLKSADLVNFINNLKKRNIIVLGTLLDTADTKPKNNNHNKVALILGSEGQGISKEVANLIDGNIKIKTNPQLESLNVAIAGSIIMSNFYLKDEEKNNETI